MSRGTGVQRVQVYGEYEFLSISKCGLRFRDEDFSEQVNRNDGMTKQRMPGFLYNQNEMYASKNIRSCRPLRKKMGLGIT